MKFIGKNKVTIIVVSFIALLAVISYMYMSSKSTINIYYTPRSSSTTINNQPAEDSNKVASGEYTITVTKDGFRPETETINIGRGDKVDLYFILESNSKETEDWYEKNEEDMILREQYLDMKIRNESDTIESNFPIMEILPYTGERGAYSIDYGRGSSGSSQAIYISYYTEVGKNNALNYIRENNYKPEDYEIIYRKLEFGEN